MGEATGEEDLSSKVADWLRGEGYPLEYFTAHTFRRHGFKVEQGAYIKPAEGNPREIDVLASQSKVNANSEPPLARVYTVVECKWTKDKPWVAFTANTGQMASSAIIAQTISSELGEASVFLEAGDEELPNLALFQSPETPCFGGRQAFGRESDVFYNAIKSVAGAARNVVERYNKYKSEDELPDAAVLAFPLIVIQGDLFEAAYDEQADQMTLQRATQTRLHWRGSKDSDLLTTVDVVTKDGLDSFVSQRAAETKVLLEALFLRANQLAECFRNKSVAGLVHNVGPTGTEGMPPFLYDLYELAERATSDARTTARLREHAAKSNDRIV
jgi:hypothetical protein